MISVGLTGQLAGCLAWNRNFNAANSLDIVNVVNVKLCVTALLAELEPFILLSLMFTIFIVTTVSNSFKQQQQKFLI